MAPKPKAPKPKSGTIRAPLDSALVFCGGAEYGSGSYYSHYGPENMLKHDSNVFCSREYHRRFLVVHDLGKPCVITGLEVQHSGYCNSNLKTVRISATHRLPGWVQGVGAAQETSSASRFYECNWSSSYPLLGTFADMRDRLL